MQFRVGWHLLILVGVCLVSANLLLSTEAIRTFLPQPNPYYQPGVETRVRALKQLLREEGEVDVLFVGSSVVRTNIQPFTFDEEIRQRTGIELITFNAGLSELDPDAVRLYLEKFWLRQSAPTVVMQGIRYSELRDGKPAEEYVRFQGSSLEAKWLSARFLDRLGSLAIEKLPLLYYRGLLKDSLKSYPMPPATGFPIDARGYNAPALTLEQARSAGLLTAEAGYKSSYKADVFARGLETLRRVAELCERQGITYVVVNIPEHGDKFLSQPDGRERYYAYLEQLHAFASARRILLIDVTIGEPDTWHDDTLYSDYHHMSPLGAELFTRKLAQQFATYVARDPKFATTTPR